MRRLLLAVSLALLLVLAGCSGLGDDGNDTATPAEPPADPAEDVIGWEDGYWYNESLSIDQSDGLNDSELDAVQARTMARVEKIRQLEFTDDVSVEVVSREEYEENNEFGGGTYGEWYETYYEAAFLVDEETNVTGEFRTLYDSSVAGYYSPRQEAIVLVSDNPDEVRVDPTTLAHELVHALQDDANLQRWGSGSLDVERATTAVSEGDANYVMDRYAERCESEWDCIDDNSGESNERPGPNRGLFASIWVPYSEGPTLIDAVYERGGWDAVNGLYSDPPDSTEQVIHPDAYPDENPDVVVIPDRSSAEWEPIRAESHGRTQGTLGEATLFAMLWHNGVIDADHVETDDRRWNYSHPATEGWGGDAVLGYSNGSASAYVFESVWDTEEDAREFRDAYVELLESKGAVEVRDGVYRIPEESGFADAFRVELDGEQLVVVNAPDVETLDEVRGEN